MSKVVSLFTHRQHEQAIKQWQGWVAEQLYWHMAIDNRLPESEIVNALGYPDCGHQMYAYQQWVKDNQTLFETHKPIKVLDMGCKQLSERCKRYFQDYNWHRPDQFER